MNITNATNTAFTAKLPVSRIKIQSKNPAMQEAAEDYFYELMRLRKDTANKLQSKLDYLNKNVKLYFRGKEVINGQTYNTVYINSGTLNTSRFDFEQTTDGESLLNAIIKHIDLNV